MHLSENHRVYFDFGFDDGVAALVLLCGKYMQNERRREEKRKEEKRDTLM